MIQQACSLSFGITSYSISDFWNFIILYFYFFVIYLSYVVVSRLFAIQGTSVKISFFKMRTDLFTENYYQTDDFFLCFYASNE